MTQERSATARKGKTPKQRVLKKYPDAMLVENLEPHMQKWFLWRDLLGCGMTPQEAYNDAARRLA